jgi:hypothetical protein
MWGVMHHLKDCAQCIKKLKQHYQLIFIREPLKNGFRLLEMGHPIGREEFGKLVSEHLPGAQVHYCGNNVMMFWNSGN